MAADPVLALRGTPSRSKWHEMDLAAPCVLLPETAGLMGSYHGSPSGVIDARILPMISGKIPEEFTFGE